MAETFDVVVIGAGSAGLTAAGGPAMFGLKAALIEEGPMGGDCLNTGCVPSKAIIAAAHRAHDAAEATRLGVTLQPASVDFAAVMAHVHQAIETIAPVDSQERFEGLGVHVYRGRGVLRDDRTVEVNGETLKAKRIVIATGSRAKVPPIPGLESVPYLTNHSLWGLSVLPRHLAIIGAGAIGMEMAQAFRRLGAQVTLLEAGTPMPRDDADAVALVTESLRSEGVDLRANVQIERVETDGTDIAILLAGGVRIVASHLLVSAGRAPNVEGLGLEAAGVKLGKDGIIVDARRRTSNPRIFAVGDCREGPRFTHTSGNDGSVATINIALGYPAKIDHRALPWVTYTDPELAQVGLTEAAARAKFGQVEVTRQDFHHNDRAIAEGDTRGWIKMMRVKGKVVGVTIVGRGAGELILPWSLTILGKASSFALGGAIVPYPNRSDLSRAVAFAAHEPSVFGPWSQRWARFVSRLRSA
jgi:pyruvate/2-oxoglutarate dehydrogenase complex dihydrolipoamide dehydrogenase (E3) component